MFSRVFAGKVIVMNYSLKYTNQDILQQKVYKKPLLINPTEVDLVFNNFLRKNLAAL